MLSKGLVISLTCLALCGCYSEIMMITTTLALATLAPLAIGLGLAYITTHFARG